MSHATDSPCQFLAWDSAFFGRRVARANTTGLDPDGLSAILQWCQAERIEWLYFLGDAEHRETPPLAQAAGFDFVDLRLELERPSALTEPPAPLLSPAIVVRPAVAADLPVLRQIASDAHRDTRYFFDRHVPRLQAEALYAHWIEVSVTHDYADVVLVAEYYGQTAAYITGHLKPDITGAIGLLAVAAPVRGCGVSTALTHTLLAWFAARGADPVRVVTQGRNVAAQRFYQRQGFQTRAAGLWYHKWFD